MKRVVHVTVLSLLAVSLATSAQAFTELIPGKLFIAKPSGKLVKVLSKPTGPVYPLPASDPSTVTTTLRVLDDGGTGGDDTYSLNGGTWKGLGSPAGSKGYKYKGAGTAADPCKVVIIKEKILKAVCKDFANGGGGITLTPPFTGTAAGAILTVDSDRYCAEWGGNEIKNDVKLVKRKDSTPPPDCPGTTPTPTPTPTGTKTWTVTPTVTDTTTPADTPTITPTPTACMGTLVQGEYTLTQDPGGTLSVDGLPPFPFPAGGTVTLDVGAAGAGNVHDMIIPFPGGFSAPAFCIPALGYTVTVEQTGCGEGKVDGDGGSDFTITERGDTSSPTICALPASCTPGANSNLQVDITVGDAATDNCNNTGGCANMIYTVPVFTTTWGDAQLPITCPDGDGMYDPGTDTLIVSFPQTLDFTTDSSNATWTDLDPDGCSLAGAGPGGAGLSATGQCLHLGTGAITIGAAGTIGSSGAPLYDLTFANQLVNTMTGPGAPLGATCASPPLINYTGTATRCVP